MKFVDPEVLQNYIDNKYISVQKHPEMDLYIYNYTQKCQFEKKWDDVTMQCRGLIMDDKGNIVARPFEKFFNLDEYTQMGNELPVEDFEVFDKLDGSLGILYWEHGKPALATRGSFTSDQAIKGTKILREKYSNVHFSQYNTYLFEIIYPENRIVVDYGDVEDIYLLASVNTQSGVEEEYQTLEVFFGDYMNVVKRFDGITDAQEVKTLIRDNAEGVVIRWKSGLRVKVKYDEYVRLHRIVTGVNAKRIWEYLRDGQPLNDLLERVPDEFFAWVKKTKENLEWEFNAVEAKATEEYDQVKNMESRKDQAIWLTKNSKLSGVVFKMLDKQDYSELIWKMVRPTADKPFKEDVDA